jgi:hypothetical protein
MLTDNGNEKQANRAPARDSHWGPIAGAMALLLLAGGALALDAVPLTNPVSPHIPDARNAFQDLPRTIYVWLGNGWALGSLLVLTAIVFGYLVPRAKAPIFEAVTTDLPRRVLDEYIMTWNAGDAQRFFREIGPGGREAYRVFYRRTDFWFPGLIISLLYVSFLTLAFPPASAFSWVSILGMAGWLFDLAENINHYKMASTYPRLANSALTVGPIFTLIKWTLAAVLPLIGIAGFATRII